MRIVLVTLAAVVACGSSVRHPPYAPQPSSALVEVTAPPPPARVEIVPASPDPSAVWVDGEWTWRHGRWAWTPGGWVDPALGAAFSPWIFERGPDGRLWVAQGVWRDRNGAPTAAPPSLASAVVEASAVVDAAGNTESTGPILRAHPRPPASAP